MSTLTNYQQGDWVSTGASPAAHVFSPLCVAHPLARKSASMNFKPPAGYKSTDPMMDREMI